MGPATRRCGGCGAAVPPEGGLGGGWFGNPSSCRLRLGPTSGSWVSPETRLYTRVREGRPCWAGRGSRAPRRWRPTCPTLRPSGCVAHVPCCFLCLGEPGLLLPSARADPLPGRPFPIRSRANIGPSAGPSPTPPPPRPAAAGPALSDGLAARVTPKPSALCVPTLVHFFLRNCEAHSTTRAPRIPVHR